MLNDEKRTELLIMTGHLRTMSKFENLYIHSNRFNFLVETRAVREET